MPENVQHHQNDRPLEAPSLLELSAEIVANNAEHLLINSKHLPGIFSHHPSLTADSSTIAASSSSHGIGQNRVVGLRDQAAEKALIQHQTPSSKQQPHEIQGLLPVRASEAVLQKMCERWQEAEQSASPEEIDTALQPFYNGNLCPLANMYFIY